MASQKSQLIQSLVWALNNRPADFERGRHRLTDKTSGLVWWVANEDYGFRLDEPNEMRFGYWQRRDAWKAVRRLLCLRDSELIAALLAKMNAANAT